MKNALLSSALFLSSTLFLSSLSLAAATPVLRAAEPVGEIPASSELRRYEKPAPPVLPPSWKWSLAPLVASQGLDIASSYGLRELNPLLAGNQDQFGAKAALLKIGLTAALAGAEYLIVKAHPRAAKVLTKMNWSGAALTTGFAAHNFSLR